MERILVAVDFSECSRQALRSAVALARVFSVPLRAVYVAPDIFHHLPATEEILPVQPGGSRLEAELGELILSGLSEQDVAGGLQLDKKLREGEEYHEILEEVEAWDASLLVVGTHGRSTLERVLLGSVSDKVFRKATCPVLIVPQSAAVRPRKILVAVDGGSSTERLLRTAADWRRILTAEIRIVHVIDDMPEPVLLKLYPEAEVISSMKKLRESIQEQVEAIVEQVFPHEPRPRVEYLVGRPSREICQAAEAGRDDLVILGPHERHGLLDLGNTAAGVAHHCRCSVLVARPEPVGA